MKIRRRTAARIIATALDEGRALTASEKAYLSNPDKQDVAAGKAKPRTLAETGAAYLKARQAVGLTWDASGKALAAARIEQGVVKPKAGKAPAFTAADIPSPEGKSKGEYLAACKAFVKAFGVKVAEARKQVGSVPAAATMTLDLGALNSEQVAALKAVGLDPR